MPLLLMGAPTPSTCTATFCIRNFLTTNEMRLACKYNKIDEKQRFLVHLNV